MNKRLIGEQEDDEIKVIVAEPDQQLTKIKALNFSEK